MANRLSLRKMWYVLSITIALEYMATKLKEKL